MSLKKSVGKNDKKAKKDVTAKIALMEAELDERHEAELAIVQSEAGDKNVCEAENELPSADGQEKRVSKAQRRRVGIISPQSPPSSKCVEDAKSAAETSRAAAIEAGEEEAKSGARQTEMRGFSELLRSRGLALAEVAADGDCLYAAVAAQLAQDGDASLGVAELRVAAATAMEASASEFQPFLLDEVTGELLDEAAFRRYVDKIRRPTVWGGEPEIRALSNALRRPIEVLQSDGLPRVIGEDAPGKPLTITYHKHAFRLGAHYNSTRVLGAAESS